MFIDYYQILEIEFPSSPDEIKKAYRRLSLKWHPDRNHGVDTSKQMVAINEAYYILKNSIKKERYDREYRLYKHFKSQSAQETKSSSTINKDSNPTYSKSHTNGYHNTSFEYDFGDSTVRDDVNEAHIYAKNLVDEFLRNLKQTSKDAAQGAWGEMWPYIIVAIILPIFFGLIRSCQ